MPSDAAQVLLSKKVKTNQETWDNCFPSSISG
jgi:hypothetical protein